METHDVGKRRFVLWGTLFKPKGKGLVFRQPTYELDPPYRYAHTVVFRLARWGLMLGTWEKSPAKSLQEHFLRALEANGYAGLTEDEINTRTDFGKQRAEETELKMGGHQGPWAAWRTTDDEAF
jgi:hypothetical protein